MVSSGCRPRHPRYESFTLARLSRDRTLKSFLRKHDKAATRSTYARPHQAISGPYGEIEDQDAIPAHAPCPLCLAALPWVTRTRTHAMEEPKPIEITAKRFFFTPNEVTVKVNEPVLLIFKSEDVTHGIHFDDLDINAQIVKGHRNFFRRARGSRADPSHRSACRNSSRSRRPCPCKRRADSDRCRNPCDSINMLRRPRLYRFSLLPPGTYTILVVTADFADERSPALSGSPVDGCAVLAGRVGTTELMACATSDIVQRKKVTITRFLAMRFHRADSHAKRNASRK